MAKSKKVDIIYPEIGVTLYAKGSEEGTLTVDIAKKLLGYVTEEEARETLGKQVNFGNDFVFKDENGVKVQLANNVANRPFRRQLAMRYANEMLRQKWCLNGETIVFDRLGQTQSGQHRLVGLILAEQIRQKDKDKWKEYGTRGPISIEALVVTGVSETAEVADTLDIGQKRSLGDVIFRTDIDFGKNVTDAAQKRMSNILSGAIRLVWLRSGGQDVSDAPYFPHSEALDFHRMHPEIVKSVKFIYDEDAGEKQISTYMSLAYAAALHYMTTVARTDPKEFADKGTEALDTSLRDKADEFWVAFAQGDPRVHSFRTLLNRIDSSGKMGRDEIVGVAIKCINKFLDGAKDITAKEIRIKKTTRDGKQILGERPRLGGIDVEVEPRKKKEKETKEKDTAAKKKKATDKKVGKRATKGKWAIGDTCWVQDSEQDGGEIWFGEITDRYDTEDGDKMVIVAMDGNEENAYQATLDQLSLRKPKAEKAAA